MISRGAPILLAAVVIAACGGGRAASSPSATTAATAAQPAATYTIDVTDMMGAFPPATFFVVDKSDVRAVALLNHTTRYIIPTSGKAVQVAAAGPAGRVYVLDQTNDCARLRWFDIDSGTERASRVVAGLTVVDTGIGHGALAVDDKQGTVYALLREPRNALSLGAVRVEEFDWFAFHPGRTMLRSTCGERLAAAAGRVVVACFVDKEGEIRVADGAGERTLASGLELKSMAMLGDGTLMAGDPQGNLVRLERQQTRLERVDTLKSYGKGLIADGIAANGDCCFYFAVVDSTANDVQPRTIAGGTALIAFPTFAQPTGGLFVQAPFAYYVIAGRARHTDITQGFSEVMSDVGPSALPGAVSNR